SAASARFSNYASAWVAQSLVACATQTSSQHKDRQLRRKLRIVTPEMKIETLAVHAGHSVDPATGAVATPIYLSTTFERDVEGTYSRGFMYTHNDNPNRS